MSEEVDAWALHARDWRDPAQILTHWAAASDVDSRLLRSSATGSWWDVIAEKGVTLFITREYEHLVMAISVSDGKPRVSFMPMPHPSGVAVDAERGRVYIASTRNPNQVHDLAPVTAMLERLDRNRARRATTDARPIVPLRTFSYPGSLYMHDLAFVGNRLHANAVGHNAVVRLDEDGRWSRVWWPRAIESNGEPDFRRNYLQLNSIAAAPTLVSSYFSASASAISSRRPGHLNFPVDRRGVVFSGRTREPIVTGLTRPHSARLHKGKLWVNNSGYGVLGFVEDGRYEVFSRLPGWTRGLSFVDDVAFVGTSRVIPRYARYAPGLEIDKSVCGVYAVDARTGNILGSMHWPNGNQIFAVEAASRRLTLGFPLTVTRRGVGDIRELFYAFSVNERAERRAE